MQVNFKQLPLPLGVQSQVTVADFVAFTEGPAVDAERSVYYSDIRGNRILKMTIDGRHSVFRYPCGRTNGQAFDQLGRLWHCEGGEFGRDGNRRITRTDFSRPDEPQVITDRYQGQRYNAPNDICIDGRGRAFFTDPKYGDRSSMEMSVDGVYRIDLDGKVTRILQQPSIHRPNGIAVTQDCLTLYLVDSSPDFGGNRKIWAFDLNDHGDPIRQREVFDFSPGRGGDGMRLDVEGNLYVAAGISRSTAPHVTDDVPPGVYVIRPDGHLLGCIPIPEDTVTNLAFGGLDGQTIYVTAGRTLYQTRSTISGQIAYPSWKSSPTLVR